MRLNVIELVLLNPQRSYLQLKAAKLLTFLSKKGGDRTPSAKIGGTVPFTPMLAVVTMESKLHCQPAIAL
jgi:hypothetical protein